MNSRKKRHSRIRKTRARTKKVPLSTNIYSSDFAFPNVTVPASANLANCVSFPSVSFTTPSREQELNNVIKALAALLRP